MTDHNPLEPCVRGSDGAVQLWLRVQPGAKRSQVMGMYGERLRISLSAPPVDGKANDELVRFVAELLGLTRHRVTLVAGQTSRDKRLHVDATRQDVLERLELGARMG